MPINEIFRFIILSVNSFNEFYLNQRDVFKHACAFYLNGLSGSEQDKIYTQIS